MTRRVAKQTRSGESSSEPVGLVYHGHRGKRETKQTDAEMLMSGGEPAASSTGAPVVETSHPDGEPAALSAGAPVEDILPPDGEPAGPGTGAPIKKGVIPDAETTAHAARSRTEEDEIEELLGSSPPESDRTPDNKWKVIVAKSSSVLLTQGTVSAPAQYFPSWFDLCEDEDPYGPILVDWLFSRKGMPVLPDIKVDPSLLSDFWREVDSSDDKHDV